MSVIPVFYFFCMKELDKLLSSFIFCCGHCLGSDMSDKPVAVICACCFHQVRSLLLENKLSANVACHAGPGKHQKVDAYKQPRTVGYQYIRVNQVPDK